MKKLIIIILLFCCYQLPTGYGQSTYWQQQVNYKIDVSLNDTEHTLDGYVTMEYYNNSPDTLNYIWIHLWPNAYKNDRTAFSDQLLENGRTDFYFSNNEQRGYINALAFKVNGVTVKTADHPEHQDIIKILLQQPLAPQKNIKIETPFHLKLPYNFSGNGHVQQAYQLTQWYPMPAVYDRLGWHPIPYLNQGGCYSEFGNYEVKITLPANYIVAATGALQTAAEKDWLKTLGYPVVTDPLKDIPVKKKGTVTKAPILPKIPSSGETKTLLYIQQNVNAFAWFANKRFMVQQDSLQLPSGKVIEVFTYHEYDKNNYWKNSIAAIKKAVLTRSLLTGEYPYEVISAVETPAGLYNSNSYPTIAAVSKFKTAAEIENTIDYEIGNNWEHVIVSHDERRHYWMNEGISSYYHQKLVQHDKGNFNATGSIKNNTTFLSKRMPADLPIALFNQIIRTKKDQPIETITEKFNLQNYTAIGQTKASQWIQLLEKELGTAVFDSCMRVYYNRWQFKHPDPDELKKLMEEISGKDLDSTFNLLSKKGRITNPIIKKDIKFVSFFDFKDPGKYNYIAISPAVGYNSYDQFMIGSLIHNYTFPSYRFQFLVTPLYATGSKSLNGLGRISYTWFPGNNGQQLQLSLAGASFNGNAFTDSAGFKKYLRYSKIVPSLKFVFANSSPRSTITRYIQWKSFFIKEQGLLFTRDTILDVDNITYPVASRYVNQLRFVIENTRALYPYTGELQAEQGKGFLRIAFTGNYFFNYAKKGGMQVRVFAGKFFYLTDKTYQAQFDTDPYHLNMTGANGYEDYTYSNYFIGRNEFEKYPSQQIMIRDGAFKVRTDLLSSKTGRTDDWLAAANFTTDIPDNINPLQVLPFKIPLKAFADIGTYAEAWKKNPETGRFLYDAGLQLSLLHNVVNIYIPILQSKVYTDYFKSTLTEKRFWKKISFSIDIQNITVKQFIPKIPFQL